MRVSSWWLMTFILLLALPAVAQEAAPAGDQPAAPEAAAEPEAAPAPEAAAEPEAAPEPEPEINPVYEPMPTRRSAAKPAKEEASAAVPNGQFVTSLGNFVKFYGTLRLDLTFDTSRTNYGNWVLWVLPNKNYTQLQPGTANMPVLDPRIPYNNSEIAVNPRFSRFGLDLRGTDIELIKAKLKGKVEIDFYGGGITDKDWAAVPRWRKAYLSLDWGDFELRAGQDADIVSPMYPRTIDSGAGWFLGNLGGRRPMIAFTYKPVFDDIHHLYIQAAAARPGTVSNADYDIIDRNRDHAVDLATEIGDGNNDGEDSTMPMWQWRVAYEAPLYRKVPFVIGISGHWQQYEFQRRIWYFSSSNYLADTFRLNSYSLAAEAQIPVFEWWKFRGEFYWGRGAADLWGAIGQEINPESLLWRGTPELVESWGAWVDSTIQPFDFWALTLGYAFDLPDEYTLPTRQIDLIENTRFMNQAIWLNNEFFLGSGFVAAFQYMHIMTDYKYVDDVTTNPIVAKRYQAMDERFQVTLMYSF